MRKILKRLFPALAVLLILFGVMIFLLSSMRYSHQFSDVSVPATKEANSIISHNLCSGILPCTQGQVFWNDLLWRRGISITIYGVHDAKTLDEISRVYVRWFLSSPKLKYLELEANKFPRRLDGLQRYDIIYSITLKKG